MDILLDIKKYISEILGIEIDFLPWKEGGKLPFFINERYKFFEISILNNSCLLMISNENVEYTPLEIKHHVEQVKNKFHDICIYVSKSIISYNRKRLIQYRIPFIIPNNQIYIPDLGMDLKEYFLQQRIRKELFSSATQSLIISTLLSKENEKFIPKELANKLHWSPMTMTRAFNELEEEKIGKLVKIGKERWWIYEQSKKSLWEQTNVFLRSPVRRKEFIKMLPYLKLQSMPLAGLSALAKTTMVNPPRYPSYAIDIDDYNNMNIPKGFRLAHKEEADFELEIWNYDPLLFSKNGTVDPFSLYLSLREIKDERIESALEVLMEKVW